MRKEVIVPTPFGDHRLFRASDLENGERAEPTLWATAYAPDWSADALLREALLELLLPGYVPFGPLTTRVLRTWVVPTLVEGLESGTLVSQPLDSDWNTPAFSTAAGTPTPTEAQTGQDASPALRAAGAEERTVLVTSVSGPSTGEVGTTARYTVSAFNVPDPTPAEKRRVKWSVQSQTGERLGDFSTGLDRNGSPILDYELPASLQGKAVVVMPYMNGPTERVSVTTDAVRPLVREVSGPSETHAGETIRYRVARFNVDAVSEAAARAVHWRIQSESGEIWERDTHELDENGMPMLDFEVPATAEGQVLTAMPYMSAPSESVSVRTRVDRFVWVRPHHGERFFIDADAHMPDITFEVSAIAAEEYRWEWTIQWHAKGRRNRSKPLRTFREHGEARTAAPRWKMSLDDRVIGGELTVTLHAGGRQDSRSIRIGATNPGEARVKRHLGDINELTDQDRTGLGVILDMETSEYTHVWADREPVASFDGGYGLMQLTNPAPDYEQAWSWKRNLEAGVDLYQGKRAAAKRYLEQSERSHTADQLQLETWARWNGGAYHRWDEEGQRWLRNPNILCDPASNNAGYDMTHQDNKGKTLEQLRTSGTPGYFGVCYADTAAARQ
jgi:hypothetical protein